MGLPPTAPHPAGTRTPGCTAECLRLTGKRKASTHHRLFCPLPGAPGEYRERVDGDSSFCLSQGGNFHHVTGGSIPRVAFPADPPFQPSHQSPGGNLRCKQKHPPRWGWVARRPRALAPGAPGTGTFVWLGFGCVSARCCCCFGDDELSSLVQVAFIGSVLHAGMQVNFISKSVKESFW